MDLHHRSDETDNERLVNDTGNEASQEGTQGEPSKARLEHELLVSGLVYPAVGNEDGVEIQRGMRILTTEGEVAGRVAGIIHSGRPQQAEYILLSRPSQQLEYRMVPVDIIQRVDKEKVLLDIAAPLVNTLRPWHN